MLRRLTGPGRFVGAWPVALAIVALVAALGPGSAGTPGVRAAAPDTSFVTDGDAISGWFWLRDPDGQDTATWEFRGVPTDDTISLDFDILATDGMNGGPGVDAQFYLRYGPLLADGWGDSISGPSLVTLPNVSPLDDPVGYSTRGSSSFAAGELPADATGLWVLISRQAEDGSVVPVHIAVNQASVIVSGMGSPGDQETPPPAGTTPPQQTIPPDATPMPPDGPPAGVPTIVAIGDSFISGEGGRWAGNTNGSYLHTDALGQTAYDNADDGVTPIPGCHRSRSAEIHIDVPLGPAVQSINLACSGATTETRDTAESYKPGIDRCPDEAYCPPGGLVGQATMLRDVALSHNVDLVVLSIGGNDFEFSTTVEQCANDFMFSAYVDKDYCNDDGSVTARFSDFNVEQVRQRLVLAYQDVITAMTEAGYSDDDWTLMVQTYPSPLAPGGDLRYDEFGYSRYSQGGCPFWDDDADWANSTVMDLINGTIRDAVAELDAPNVLILDVRNILVGHRLCEDTVDLVGTSDGAGSWTDTDASDKSEWVQQIRALFSQGGVLELPGSVYQKIESFHPDYWGQLALRNCLRQAYNNGNIRGGACEFMQDGLNDRGEPTVILMTGR